MALLFMDGFDHYSLNEMTHKWTARESSSIYSNDIKPTSGRRGGGALLVGSSGGLYKSVPARATFILGVAIYPVTMPSTGGGQPLFELREGSTQQLYVFIDTAAKLRVYRGGGVLLATSDNPLPIATWSYVEFKATIDNTVGAYELRVNGQPWLSASGIDTQNSANAFANYACLGISGANDANVYYDDFYLCDTSGVVHHVGECARSRRRSDAITRQPDDDDFYRRQLHRFGGHSAGVSHAGNRRRLGGLRLALQCDGLGYCR